MFEKTKAIVLNQIKYDDKKRIITVYSEKYGRASFIISNSKKLSINLFQTFNILNLDIKTRNNSTLYRVTEASVHLNYKTIPYSIEKSSIAIFLSEILYKILKEETENKDMFNFIVESINILDINDNNISIFHLIFLMKLTSFFGFFPYNNNDSNSIIFDLIDGVFTNIPPLHKNYLTKNDAENFKHLINLDYNSKFKISKNDKSILLNNLIRYISIQSESVMEIKSLGVLKEIFN